MADPFLGQIMPVAFNYPPIGWLACNGNVVGIQQYQALYAVLGTVYGGNGTTTFGLPNLLGRVIMGAGTTPTTNINYPQGSSGGNVNGGVVFSTFANGSVTATNIPQMSFSVPASSFTATTTVSGLQGVTSRAPNPTGNMLTSGVDSVNSNVLLNYAPNTAGNGNVVALAAASAATTLSGSSTGYVGTVPASLTPLHLPVQGPVATLPPYQSVLYIIATQGVFPARN